MTRELQRPTLTNNNTLYCTFTCLSRFSYIFLRITHTWHETDTASLHHATQFHIKINLKKPKTLIVISPKTHINKVTAHALVASAGSLLLWFRYTRSVSIYTLVQNTHVSPIWLNICQFQTQL